MQMPGIYADFTSTLYDAKRNANHLPPTVIDLDYDFTEPTIPVSELVANNLSIMYRQVVSGATTGVKSFFLVPHTVPAISLTPDRVPLRTKPHGPVHIWTGLFDEPHEDMGNLYCRQRPHIFSVTTPTSTVCGRYEKL